jgi:hypothetical protein
MGDSLYRVRCFLKALGGAWLLLLNRLQWLCVLLYFLGRLSWVWLKLRLRFARFMVSRWAARARGAIGGSRRR